eukprot:3937185-Rhodomonas_salina.1
MRAVETLKPTSIGPAFGLLKLKSVSKIGGKDARWIGPMRGTGATRVGRLESTWMKSKRMASEHGEAHGWGMTWTSAVPLAV